MLTWGGGPIMHCGESAKFAFLRPRVDRRPLLRTTKREGALLVAAAMRERLDGGGLPVSLLTRVTIMVHNRTP